MRVDALRKRMSPAARGRFDYVWDLVFRPALDLLPPSVGSPSSFSPAHARRLAECGVARPTSGPGFFACVPFTVLEEKEAGLRQRFILWTVDANRAAEAAGYEAAVPLGHVSEYLPAIRAECGTTRDFRTGFYAVEVPESARSLFRFCDSDGAWWELTRLPMGHSCAPEIMHTLAAVSAGHPDYVLPQFAERGVVVDVWIDNIRYTGSKQRVAAATTRLDGTAVECALTWKDADSRTVATTYEFIGVEWNHKTHRVVVSRKLRRRLMETRYALRGSPAMSAGDIETLGGRLLHASAVAGVFPGSFYFSLKSMRRVTNSLNRGERLPSDEVPVSSSVCASLRDWIDSVLKPRAVPEASGPPSLTAFVDASKKGWGGVLVDSRTAEISILGSSWSRAESELHINELEAKAFELVIRSLPDSVAGGRLDVVVDNTTVQGVARKGACLKSAVLNDSVVSGLERVRSLRCAVSVRWVRSAGNPADLPSRVPLTAFTPQSVASITRAVRDFFTGVVADGK
ncbi:hypothetical protein DIPPA_20572 [Diplonema papillatum]|nr:hypothetical protein DIPPA_29774 [Diplonema papillatum]KAJ9462849.1 hypothetical protein DIPPA_20572 [Diplonema papillatum]|eukprot:gene308-biopygen318